MKKQSRILIQAFSSLLSFFLTFISCAQPPADRAHAENPDFDKKISRTISFTVPTMSVADLKQQQEEVIILDARELEEYEVSHIPNAVFIGYNKLDKKEIKKLPKDKRVVLYCSIGYRSEKIGEKLQKMGFTDVHNLYGSIFEWVNQGYEVVDQEGLPTKSIHTYNEKWSQWVKNSTFNKTW